MLVNTSGSATLTAVIAALCQPACSLSQYKRPMRAMCITRPSLAGRTELHRPQGASLRMGPVQTCMPLASVSDACVPHVYPDNGL